MFFLSHFCQSPFLCWESQSTSPPEDAFYHCADLWTCCGGSSHSNPVLLLCVLVSNVHSSFVLWAVSVAFYLFYRHSLPGWSCGFNLQLVWLVGRFWVFFLSHTAPGFQLWFYFHLCMWVVHWDLAPHVALEALGLPLGGPGVEVVQLLGSQGSTRFSGGLVARAAGNIVL